MSLHRHRGSRRTRAAGTTRWRTVALLLIAVTAAPVAATAAVYNCTSASQCHGFRCSDALCVCGNEWYEPDCEQSYIDELGVSWPIFLAILGVEHGVLALVAGSILLTSRRERGWRRLNSREWTVLVTFVGCVMRLVWATRDRSIIHRPDENAWLEGMLLRVPQVLWMGGSVILINVWVRLVNQFGSRAKYDRVARRCKYLSASFMGLLAALGLPLTVYSSVVSPDFVVSQLANLLFSAYLIALTIAGTVYVRKMLRLLDTYRQTLAPGSGGSTAGAVGPMRDRRAAFMRRLVVFVAVSCGLGWEVVIFTVVNIVADLQAKLYPVAHLIFMYDVHVVAEGGFAAVYCYVCWGRAVASAKYATPASARGARGSLPTSPTTGVALPPPSAARGRLGSAPAVPGGSKRASAKLKGARPRPGEVVTVDNPVTQASATAEVQQVGSGLEAAARRSSTIAV